MFHILYLCCFIGAVIIVILSVFQLVRIADAVTRIADHFDEEKDKL